MDVRGDATEVPPTRVAAAHLLLLEDVNNESRV